MGLGALFKDTSAMDEGVTDHKPTDTGFEPATF